jgi:mRNA-degrading endonuclease RelE of RelBE toxin-antitoxin system
VGADAVRIGVVWATEARSDLRGIDRETAIQILRCVDRYLASREGDVKKLKPPRSGFRLRCGDYRVFFDNKAENAIKSRRSATEEKLTDKTGWLR